MTQLSTLHTYFWKYRWLFILGILFVILTNYFRIISAAVNVHVINTVVEAMKEQPSAKTGQPLQQDAGLDVMVSQIIRWFDGMSYQHKILYTGLILLLLAIISGFSCSSCQTIIVMSRHIEYDQKNAISFALPKLDMSFTRHTVPGSHESYIRRR